MMNYKKFVPYLLGLVAVLLAILVPGGPVETRDFSQLSPLVFWGFNTFLTTLVIITFVLIYFTLNEKNWAFKTAMVLGFLYLLVYALDLARIFPVSPDAMSTPLFLIEVTDSIVALLLLIFSYNALKQE